ncbi:MAG: HAMP domain-containing protein [Blautia sp.]|nr:HAMP domain-containing protein [Blautia sp.]
MRDQKAKPVFRSMKNQIAFTFGGLFLLLILLVVVINGIFLEKFYVSQKADVLLQAREYFTELDMDALFFEQQEYGSYESDVRTDKEYPKGLSVLSSQNNLSWIITTQDNFGEIHWGENEGQLQGKLFGYAYDIDEDMGKRKILKEADHYVIQKVYDHFSEMNYIECWGVMDEEYYFLIRTPLEGIKNSVSISNTFYIIVGCFIVIFGVILISVITGRITQPISELTELSQRMSGLDFEAKYESHAGNEIDVLGDNYNKMSDHLERTISDLKTANLELQRDIEDKIKIDMMRKEFLDNVSHELKTPIALIQGYAEGLKDNIMEDPEEREFYCDVIMDEALKMNKLVKNLLTLNQLESGKDAPVMERFDIHSLIQGVLQKMGILISQKEAHIQFSGDLPVYVWADEFKTEEVVTNYVSNALNHLDDQKQVRIQVCQEAEKVRVSVFNTGEPIPETELQNLWTKFYKVDKARTREYGGSGIGLSIVKAIMDGMNQEYGVLNHDDGVEFWFTLERE